MKLRNKKTKDICEAEAREDGIYIKASWSDEEEWFHYDLETLASGWDYYVEPVEPLIKDKRLRNILRGWAKEQFAEELYFDKYWLGFRYGNAVITVWGDIELEDGKGYTIEELCGNEEAE